MIAETAKEAYSVLSVFCVAKDTDNPDMPIDFMEWAEMRKVIKKPITSKATVTRALNKLYGMTDSKSKQIAIVEYAIDKNWTSFWPMKPKAYKEFEPEPEINAVPMPEEVRRKADALGIKIG